MGDVYAMRRLGSPGVTRFRASRGQSAREIFDMAIACLSIVPEAVHSFYRAGRDIPLDGPHGSGARVGHHIPGKELIFEMRNLPALSPDATMIHQGWFNHLGHGGIINPQALRISDRAAEALRELEDLGLAIVEPLAEGRFRHILTRDGLDRPRMVLSDAKYGIPFRMVERIEADPEPLADEDGEEPAGP